MAQASPPKGKGLECCLLAVVCTRPYMLNAKPRLSARASLPPGEPRLKRFHCKCKLWARGSLCAPRFQILTAGATHAHGTRDPSALLQPCAKLPLAGIAVAAGSHHLTGKTPDRKQHLAIILFLTNGSLQNSYLLSKCQSCHLNKKMYLA